MSEEEQSFLQYIRANPRDDGARLGYADWLEERGNPERAEFIRCGVALATGRAHGGHGGAPLTPESRTRLQTRHDALLPEQRREWTARLKGLGVQSITFHRGFPEGISLTAENFLAHAEELFARAPICEALIQRMGDAEAHALAASPHLANLTSLDLSNNRISSAGAVALAASPHLANLTEFRLRSNNIRDIGARALAASPHLAKLNTLDLSNNRIGPEGAQALAQSPHLARLTRLQMWGNEIGEAGTQALASSPNLAHLTILGLGSNGIRDAGAVALAESPYMAGLTSLDLGGNGIRDAGAVALAASPHLGSLKYLRLSNNRIGPTGGRVLASSPHLTNLTNLLLDGSNPIGMQAQAEIQRILAARRERCQQETIGRGI